MSGRALLSLTGAGAVPGQPEPSTRAKATVKAVGADIAVGGRLRGRRIAILKEVVKRHGLNLIAASKYVKKHQLCTSANATATGVIVA